MTLRPSPPPRGSYAIDTRTDRIGQVMDHEGAFVQLRPPRGGREWDCPPESLRSVAPGEALSARVRELNRESRMP